jgi:VCBS repeat-containing protein
VAAGQGVLANDRDVDASDNLRVGAVAVGAASLSAEGVGRALTGTYGTLTLAADGSYVYRVDTAAGQALRDGEAATEVFSYSVIDGHGGVTSSSLTLALTGTADQPVISGSNSGAVKVGRNLATSGQLSARDADAGESGFMAGSLAGLYGSLVIDLAGQWTYTADPALIPSGFSAPERIVVSTLDGTPVAITISVNGPDAILVAAVSPMASGSVFGASMPTLIGGGGVQEQQQGGNVSATMDSGPAAATEAGAGRSAGVPTAGAVPVVIADTPLGALTGSSDSPVAPPAVSLTGLSGSSGAIAAQPRGVLGSSDEGRGAVLGLGVPPVFQQPPVVIPQTMGLRVFYTGAVLGAVSPMVQNIRLANSLISVPSEIDRQDASTIMAIDAGTTQASPLSPDTPMGDTAGTPDSGPTIAPLSAELPALPPGMFPVTGETTAALLDSQPELPAAEAAIDSTSSLAVLAGSVAGALRIQWNLPDPAATRKGRRASSRRAA